MNKNNSAIVVLLLVLIAGVAYLALKPKDTEEISPTPTPPTGQTTTNTNPNGNDYQPHLVTNENLIIKNDWGVSFEKGADWTITSNTGSAVDLKQTSGNNIGDTISVQYVSGNKITDTDAKFGNITFFYDTNAQMWMETNDEQGGPEHEVTGPALPTLQTKDNTLVFKGVGRWATYIVPLSHTTFLKLNITGGGLSQPLTDLVKTIKKI